VQDRTTFDPGGPAVPVLSPLSQRSVHLRPLRWLHATYGPDMGTYASTGRRSGLPQRPIRAEAGRLSGIAAIHDASRLPVESGLLSAMLEQIAHRGGSVSTWRAEGIALGQHTPVSTPEAREEALPIGLANGRFQVALDGRLDNRDDLLAGLGAGGHGRGMTDPELIAMAYEKWGLAAPRRLIGDFAFVLWDACDRRLVAVRDQRGFRPLVYARHSRRLILGSEARQLFAYPDVPRTVDALYFASHLTGARTSGSSTPYASIAEVPPGHFLLAEGESLTVERFWRFEAGEPLRYRRDEEYTEHFEAAFAQAVAASLRDATKPVIVLSGGLDSSYAAAIAAQSAPGVRALYGYGRGRDWMEEQQHARAVARYLDIPLTEVDVSDCWGVSRKYLDDSAFDQPYLPMQATFMTRLATGAVGLGSTVLLDGVRCDEVADGPANERCSVLTTAQPMQALTQAMTRSSSTDVPSRQLFLDKGVASQAPASVRNRLLRRVGRRVPLDIPPWVETDTLRALGLSPALPAQLQAPSGDWSTDLQVFWTRHESERMSAVAWRERHASLPNAVETRSPFWDMRVLELVSRMPLRLGLQALLRSAALPRLPRQVVELSRRGKVDEVIDEGSPHLDLDRVAAALEGPLASLLYIDAGALMHELDVHRASRHRWSRGLWRAVTGGLWLLAEESAGPHRNDAPATSAGPRAHGRGVSHAT
jgi:asparagine synthase (glutamine-hydrolysing)